VCVCVCVSVSVFTDVLSLGAFGAFQMDGQAST